MISESKSESDGHLDPLDVDGPWTGRGTAAAATWIFRGGVQRRGGPAKRMLSWRWNAGAVIVVAPRNIHVAATAVPRPVHGPSASRGTGGCVVNVRSRKLLTRYSPQLP